MAFSVEEYSNYKQNGAIVTGTQQTPQLSILNYNSRSGIREADTLTSVNIRTVNFWIAFYQQKIDNLQDLKAGILALPVGP